MPLMETRPTKLPPPVANLFPRRKIVDAANKLRLGHFLALFRKISVNLIPLRFPEDQWRSQNTVQQRSGRREYCVEFCGSI